MTERLMSSDDGLNTPDPPIRIGTGVMDYFIIVMLGTTVIVAVAFFTGYLVKRSLSNKGAFAPRSKADRPLWILGILLAAILWLTSSLLLYGSVNVSGISRSSTSLAAMKWLVQYAAGFMLWFNLVLYRIIRIYLRMTRIKTGWQPWSLLAVLQAPFVTVSLLALVVARVQFSPNGWLIQSMGWNVAMILTVLAYATTFVYFTIKAGRVMERHHEMYRYVIFCGTSLVFPLYDLLCLLATSTDAMRVAQAGSAAVQSTIVAVQMTAVIACLTVIGNMGHLYFLVLRRKRTEMPRKELFTFAAFADLHLDARVDVERQVPRETDLVDPDMDGEDPITDIPALTDPTFKIIPETAKRWIGQKRQRDLDGFLREMPPEVSNRVDRDTAYYSYRNRPKASDLTDANVQAALDSLK